MTGGAPARRLRIAFFVSDYPVASETFVLRQIGGMLDRGHDVTVVAGRFHADAPDPFAGRAAVRVVRRPGGRARALRLLARPRALGVALRTARTGLFAPLADLAGCGGRRLGDYDAIVAHFGPAGVRAMYLREAGLLSGPIATVFHGLDLTGRGTVAKYLPHYRTLFARTEAVLPISELWRRRLLDWGAPPERTRVLRMGVDVDALSMGDPDRPPSRPLRVLSVARLVEKKGLRYAIEGVGLAEGDVRLDIIGYGPLEAELRDAAEAFPGRVALLGKRPHAEVFERLRGADLFLLPSVVAADGDMEGVPVSLMEAMATGVLVLSTRHSGIPELVGDGVEGVLVPERDARAIADALGRFGRGGYDLGAMRRAARAKVEREFNNAELDVRLEGLLLELATSARAAPHRRGRGRSSTPRRG